MAKPTEDPQTLTPPEVARRWRINPEKVIGFIRSGELVAFNVGTGKTKPRYRISQQSVDDFESSRSAVVQPKAVRRRRRKDPSIIEFFS